jgi:hypothetical protein
MIIEINPRRADAFRAVFPQCRREDFKLLDNHRWIRQDQDGEPYHCFTEIWEITGPSESIIALKHPQWAV